MAMLDKTTPQSQVAMRHCIHPSIAWSGSTHRVIANLWCGIAEAQIKFPYAEIPDLSEILSIKPGAGQNLALRALPTARESAALISAMLVHSTSHVVNPPPTEKDVSHNSDLQLLFTCGLMNCVLPCYDLHGQLGIKYQGTAAVALPKQGKVRWILQTSKQYFLLKGTQNEDASQPENTAKVQSSVVVLSTFMHQKY